MKPDIKHLALRPQPVAETEGTQVRGGSLDAFRAAARYVAVRLQQGRVQTDADASSDSDLWPWRP